MNWFMDMCLLFMEWLLLMIIPLLIGILIGWIIWGRKSKKENVNDTRSNNASKELNKKVDDDLSKIKGIDDDIETKLKDKGITSYYSLAMLSNEDVDNLEKEFDLEDKQIRTENWVPQAAQLHFEEYDESIYDDVTVDAVYEDEFEAQLAEAKKGVSLDYEDDLKQINGVGPKMEALLRSFGITTFYHLSKINDEGITALNDKMEFFPGRIQRDNWVEQAKQLHEKLHK